MKATASERRESLLVWLRERPAHSGLTAREIVNVIGYPYDEVGHYRESRCFDDLTALEAAGYVKRDGRPARWVVR